MYLTYKSGLWYMQILRMIGEQDYRFRTDIHLKMSCESVDNFGIK